VPIIVEDLEFGYSDQPVLNAANAAFEESLIHLVLGATGSGKTTLALMMVGLLEPRRGSVSVDGVNPASRALDRRTLQLAFQFPEAQMFESTVEREIEYGLRNFGFNGAETSQRRRWAMECLDISEGLLARDPARLSFGERRRVALASVVALRPKYLILDEPLAGLDWYGRRHLVETLRRLKADGLTTLVFTHESDLVGETGDTVTAVFQGRILAPAAPEAFLASAEMPDLLPDYAAVLQKVKALSGLPAAVPRRPDEAATQAAK
jgi:energy-coupling factor transporter ATP-binding protein EcfA2